MADRDAVDVAPEVPEPSAQRALRALAAWWKQGWRSLFLMRPDWSGLRATPAVVASLVGASFALGLAVERTAIPGPATFYWAGLQSGWIVFAMMAWVCWLLVPREHDAPAHHAPSGAALFGMLNAQALPATLVSSGVLLPVSRYANAEPPSAFAQWVLWGLWVALLAWVALAQVALLWRSGSLGPWRKGVATLVLLGGLALTHWLQPVQRWYPSVPDIAEGEAAQKRYEITQEKFEQQANLLNERLQAMQAQRPHLVDVYTITFAPYGGVEVFRRESELVAGVMQSRFDSGGRTIQLVNHRETEQQWPWATPLNLHRAIQRVGALMNRDEDVLFIHLTSHGARDGQLSTSFWPLTVDPVTPPMLKAWLDEAGIRYRVVSVSACYSGTWIAPLSDPATLVMTAADSTHTSFGCGSRSDLTYFARAVFDEQMRSTWSFEQALAAARPVIEKREREAGKTDGYSNPQIAVGSEIRSQLTRLANERAAAAVK